MKKKRVYKILCGIMTAMASIGSAETQKQQDENDAPYPPLGLKGRSEGEDKPEEDEIPSSVGEPTASPQGEAEEEETVILRTQSEESREQDSADSVEGDSSPSAQNDEERTAQHDGFSPCPPLGGRDKGEGEEKSEEEEIDLRTPTADGLRFERREGTQSYAVTRLAEDGKEATRVIVPKELFGCPVTEIGEGAFRGCRSLQEVVIPEGVTKIGDRAFYGCYALERIELPDSLKSVGDEVFYLCMAITSQTEYDNAYYIGNRRNPYVLLSIHKAGDISSCAVHRATKFIDRGAFAECRTLTDIEIPNGVLGIGSKAFYNCSALEGVSFGSGLVRIGESAFYGCTALHGAKFSGAREAWERIEIEEENEPLFPPAFLS